jgi:branched-chain amino acid transport system substrate-binding protein
LVHLLRETIMHRAFGGLLVTVGTLVTTGITDASAQDVVRIGVSVPLTGPFAQAGQQMATALKLFLDENGTSVAGKKVEVLLRDDGGVADQAKRIAQELVVNDKVAILAGYLPTPSALAVAPIASEAKIPLVVTGSTASVTAQRSPYIVRTFATQAQITVPMAHWAITNGIKRVATLVSDFAPGIETEKAFVEKFRGMGGEIIGSLRVPLQNPDFAPYLQRARDAKPEALFVWIPGAFAAPFIRQYRERGLSASGIKLIGIGDVTDDDVVNLIGDAVLGTTTSLQYSAAHPSAMNKAFVEGFKRVGNGKRPDHVGVALYDGMYLIYAALKRTHGNANGDALMAAMKGMTWESPRGTITVDPETRDLVQDVYIRRVERVDGELYNVEFDKYEAVKDPGQTAELK